MSLNCIFLRAAAVAVVALPIAVADFALHDDGAHLTVLENDKPVLVYNYGMVDPPEAIDKAHYARSCYIHPLYGLQGELISEDFPAHHAHQRGVFWAWPEGKLGDRRLDVWALTGIRQHFDHWLSRDVNAQRVEIGVQNVWRFDGEPKPVMREAVSIAVFHANEFGRAIDVRLTYTNPNSTDVTFLGAKDKGYGGFGFCPHTEHAPFVFTTKGGVCPDDALYFETPWADVSWAGGFNGVPAGAAIFQHPANPGYPHPGWMFRHYGYLGAAWPHEKEFTLAPRETVELKYRLYIHRGNAEEGRVPQEFDTYTRTNS